MSSTPVCFFHDRHYSSNTQRILNILRLNIIKTKCDLNLFAKKCLCICSLFDTKLLITDEKLNKIQAKFDKIKVNYQWSDEIDRILQQKMNICDSKISKFKLLRLICDICNEATFSQMIGTIPRVKKDYTTVKSSNRSKSKSTFHRRRIELTCPPNQLGHLLGRHGHVHKIIMKETNTRIHFDNAPYSTSIRNRCSEFDLELFQSSLVALRVTITGETLESVEQATKALKELDESYSD